MGTSGIAAPPPLDAEAFLAFIDARPAERYELIDGQPMLMTGATERHNMIAGNVFAGLRAAAKRKNCRLFIADVFARSRRSDWFIAAPDVMVSCNGRNDESRFVENPTIIVEVLSRSTLTLDRGYKFEQYRMMPSVQQVVFIYQDQVRVESWTRPDGTDEDAGWSLDVGTKLTDSLTCPALSETVPLAEIFADTDLAAE